MTHRSDYNLNLSRILNLVMQLAILSDGLPHQKRSLFTKIFVSILFKLSGLGEIKKMALTISEINSFDKYNH